ncbi:hypothetical protein LOK49_LG04G01156 [Camellia lanceoleosa]|uniref:Uncharacterized protein n=1 Tax=Camellia lanceoleosa TaxID=1840588 RepID=A0ACC0I3K3_9ERIC|nr:hypothetical protein LOK49_LG04G01156 [Camellia lanceoleosa]
MEALTITRHSAYSFDDSMEILSSDEEDDDQEGHPNTEQPPSEFMNMPTISFPKKLLQKIRKPWESALIIKLLGKSIGYNILCTQVIMDHYLIVRKWEPNFKPSEAFETTTTIWVQFPELSIEYYQDKVLFAIAKTSGKPLKID